MIIAILIVLGLCFGSFVNALVWRLHQTSLPKSKRRASKKELSIGKGRSMCVNCGHTLGAKDLLPVVSWIGLRGKCRYCKKSISWQYPLVELVTALLFVASYAFWPQRIVGWEIALFGLWLVALTAFVALIIYDLRWMILPNRIIFPMYGVAAVYILVKLIQTMSLDALGSAVLGVLVGGGIFYLLFIVSNGAWIGGGDVKLGFLLGAFAGDPLLAALMLFLASILGTLMILPLSLKGKDLRKTRIPFGPFLICSAIIVQLFGTAIIDWYSNSIIGV